MPSSAKLSFFGLMHMIGNCIMNCRINPTERIVWYDSNKSTNQNMNSWWLSGINMIYFCKSCCRSIRAFLCYTYFFVVQSYFLRRILVFMRLHTIILNNKSTLKKVMICKLRIVFFIQGMNAFLELSLFLWPWYIIHKRKQSKFFCFNH